MSHQSPSPDRPDKPTRDHHRSGRWQKVSQKSSVATRRHCGHSCLPVALQPDAGAGGNRAGDHPDVPVFSHKIMAERVEKGEMEKGEI